MAQAGSRTPEECHRREAFNLMQSMPAGTPAFAVQQVAAPAADLERLELQRGPLWVGVVARHRWGTPTRLFQRAAELARASGTNETLPSGPGNRIETQGADTGCIPK